MDTTVVENPQRRRFEVLVDGQVAGFAAYRPGEREWTFTHTEVDPAYEGRGLGSVLVGGALAQLRARGLEMRPECPFVLRYVQRHPEELDLVPAGARERYGLPPA